MRTKGKIALILVAVLMTAFLGACAPNGVKGEWKNDETGMRIVFEDNKTGILYTPMFGTELENELTYAVDGDQLTIGFVNSDETESTEEVTIQNGSFTYMGINFVHEG